MAYAAVIFLKHNIQHLLNCTLSFGNTEQNRGSKVEFGSEVEVEALNNEMGRLDGTISRKIEEEMQSLTNTLGRLDGARNRCINWIRINEVDAEIRDAGMGA